MTRTNGWGKVVHTSLFITGRQNNEAVNEEVFHVFFTRHAMLGNVLQLLFVLTVGLHFASAYQVSEYLSRNQAGTVKGHPIGRRISKVTSVRRGFP